MPWKGRQVFLGILVKSGSQAPGSPKEIPGVMEAAQWAVRHQRILYTSPANISRQGGRLLADGWCPDLTTETWVQVHQQELFAVYNRFPRSRDPEGLRRVAKDCDELSIPIANHPDFRELVQDKWETVQVLKAASVPVPETVLSLGSMSDALRRWRYAFLKPRYGAFGEEVYAITWRTGDLIRVEGPVVGQSMTCTFSQWITWITHQFPPHDVILQQAIVPPLPTWRGFAVRTLLQQTTTGDWHHHPRVARLSESDPVANVSRGAQALPLTDCLATQWGIGTAQQLEQSASVLEQQVVQALLTKFSGRTLCSVVEMGIDLLLDAQQQWWVLEVNGFPQGRLRYLARLDQPQFKEASQLAHCLPLAVLASHFLPPKPYATNSSNKG